MVMAKRNCGVFCCLHEHIDKKMTEMAISVGKARVTELFSAIVSLQRWSHDAKLKELAS